MSESAEELYRRALEVADAEILYPREHCDLDGLPPALQAELGPLLVRVERAAAARISERTRR